MRRRVKMLVSKAFGRMPPFILMYHRVHRASLDPWDLAVTPECFSEQIEIVRRHYTPVTLSEIAAAHVPDRAIAITFDDGYLDTLVNAKPILEKHDCPATVFIPTGLVGQKRDFWWDELARLVFEAPSIPPDLTMSAKDRVFLLSKASFGRRRRDVRRQDVHFSIWEWLLPLEHQERLLCLDQIAVQVRVSNSGRPENRTVDSGELQALASELIEIGAHTVTHAALPYLSPACQHREVLDSRRACEEIVGRPPTSFAYPNGLYNADSLSAVQAAGFSLACTVKPDPVSAWSRPLELPRVQVKNWNGDEFSRRLSRHFTDR